MKSTAHIAIAPEILRDPERIKLHTSEWFAEGEAAEAALKELREGDELPRVYAVASGQAGPRHRLTLCFLAASACALSVLMLLLRG